jgi:hypothetical protein
MLRQDSGITFGKLFEIADDSYAAAFLGPVMRKLNMSKLI